MCSLGAWGDWGELQNSNQPMELKLVKTNKAPAEQGEEICHAGIWLGTSLWDLREIFSGKVSPAGFQGVCVRHQESGPLSPHVILDAQRI